MIVAYMIRLGSSKTYKEKQTWQKQTFKIFPTCLPGCHMNPTDGKTVKKAPPLRGRLDRDLGEAINQ
jgi:hypothetical protein